MPGFFSVPDLTRKSQECRVMADKPMLHEGKALEIRRGVIFTTVLLKIMMVSRQPGESLIEP